MVGHPMDDQQDLQGEDGSVEIKEGYAECNKCGDVVLADQLAMHTQQIHENEGINKDSTISITPLSKGSSPRPRNIIMRACPVCGVEMRSDSIPKHCKMKHKVSYRYCSSCSKYVLKKYYKSHVRKHDTGDVAEDEEEDEEGMDTSNTAVKGPSKIYNCVDCTRMFMSAEAHANHLREVHGGEGGSVVLKLPGNPEEDEDVPEDQLVIDDS